MFAFGLNIAVILGKHTKNCTGIFKGSMKISNMRVFFLRRDVYGKRRNFLLALSLAPIIPVQSNVTTETSPDRVCSQHACPRQID